MVFRESFILWSGGKESYLSYKKAIERGFKVRYALSYVEERSRRLIGCYIRESVIKEQLKLLGLKFVPVYGSKRKGNFEFKLKEALSGLDIKAGIFGDVKHSEHRSFLERVCGSLGFKAVFPLWRMSEEVLLGEILKVSKPFIVCRRVRKLPRRFLGGELSREVINYLQSRDLSVSGEEGEYQTLVFECEDFSMKLFRGKSFRRSYYECIDLEVV